MFEYNKNEISGHLPEYISCMVGMLYMDISRKKISVTISSRFNALIFMIFKVRIADFLTSSVSALQIKKIVFVIKTIFTSYFCARVSACLRICLKILF